MISRADVEAVVQRGAVLQSPVLSVYLDVDPGKAGNQKRGFEAALEDMLRGIAPRADPAPSESFSADAERVRRYIAALEPRGKGAIAFSEAAENFFWAREIRVPLRNQARWSDTPYVVPLLAILDEHERYGVVLMDRARARLFTVFLGEIEEHEDLMALPPVGRVNATGTDQWLSQRRFQSHAEAHVHRHLKRAAEALDKLVDRYGFDRLLLAGPAETAGQLPRLLSKRVRARVAARLALPAEASPAQVLDATLEIERRVEREMEKKLIDELIAADGHHPVTLGIEPTVRAVCEERVWELAFADGFNAGGGQCANCGMLFTRGRGACDYCGGPLRPVDDLLERMAELVLKQDGKIEEVEGEAARRLQQVGGIGAFLRF